MRALVVPGVVIVGVAALLAMRPAPVAPLDQPQLSYVTTARQLGVVGYRDPAGAISPDGKRFAYSEGRFIRVIPVGGGAAVTLPPADQQVRHLAWTSNDTVVAVPRPASSFVMADGTAACVADRRIIIPCDGVKQALDPDVDVIGPIAFTAERVYFASPNDMRPVDAKQPDKRITFLGRGAEVGWPRWSPNGKSVLLNGARKSDGASVLYTIGVNQDTGEVASELKEVAVVGIDAEMGHSEWLPDSTTIVSIAKEGPGRHVIFSVRAGGGAATIVHRFQTEHDFSGLGVSPDGKFVAFAAPAPDGYYQVFKKAIAGESNPVQLTNDPSNKTQPAWSPDGDRVAFTVWSYDATFWSFKPSSP